MTIVACARCDRERPHHGRNLCRSCYQWACINRRLNDYPPTRDQSMDIDEVVVERAAEWLDRYYRSTTGPERRARAGLEGRPPLSRGEKIAVLAATRRRVPAHVATRALGISGSRAAGFLAAAAVAA